MFKKNQRILWLLNHRTLMPYECPLMQRLGFEVFAPKVIPANNFRSGAVDFSYDPSLSIPGAALARLNDFNFYEDVWPADIVTIVNRFFGTVFTIPYGRQVEEVVDKFEGQIVFRAFGLDATRSYRDVLGMMYGSSLQRKLEVIAPRFWFGEGYDNLHEIEDPLFADRALFLPIGVPDAMWNNANEWRGTERTILFLCPNAVTDPYYSGVYEAFKRELGDLPHVIIGAQDVPFDNPNVKGFISDSELERLYLECAVLYYPSTEPRHVHYSPIEAAIKGMPVVFYRDSLLDRLSRNVVHGHVATAGEARVLVERILEGDTDLIESIRGDQREISVRFSDAYCSEVWRASMEARGFNAALGRRSGATTVGREILRTLMRPVAHGRTKVDPHRHVRRPQRVTTSAAEAALTLGSTLADGIDFTQPEYPAHVLNVSGIGWGEGWGRWSIAETVVFSLGHVLTGNFRLYVRAFGYGPNVDVPTKVKIGSQSRVMQVARNASHAGTYLHFDLSKPSNIIEITVPKPVIPPNDNRTVGIAFVEIRELPSVTRTAAESRAELGCSLTDGIDFALDDRPAFVDAIEGLSEAEPWGRWSTGKQVTLELNHILEGNLRLAIRAIAFGRNVGAPVKVRVGDQQRILTVPGSLGADDESILDFDLSRPANRITFTVPHPTIPPNDRRTIGLGLIRIRAA